MSRRFAGLTLAVACLACRGSATFEGRYMEQGGRGRFLTCESPARLLMIEDSVLSRAYRAVASAPSEILYLRLKATPFDSGSIYGGSTFLRVERIQEVRKLGENECPVWPAGDSLAKGLSDATR